MCCKYTANILYCIRKTVYSCSFYANLIKIRLVNPLLNNIEACIAYHHSWVVIPYKYLTKFFDLKHFWNNLCPAILHYYNDFYLIHLFCVQLRYAMFILIYNSLPFLSLPKMYVFILKILCYFDIIFSKMFIAKMTYKYFVEKYFTIHILCLFRISIKTYLL